MIYGIGDAITVNFPAYKHPLYWRWVNMVGRCYYLNHTQYKSYGGKGVFVEPFLLNFGNYVSFVSKLPNYDNLLCDPGKWDIDKDKLGGQCYSRGTLQIIPTEENVHLENENKSRQVEMINDAGNIINRYDSLSAAESATGISKRNISRGAKNHIKAGGYFWRYCLEPI